MIHSDVPIFQNIGVLVNDTLFYPGDAFTIPAKPFQLLAIPVGSPWANVAEEVDYMKAVKPHQAFPTHNAHLSEIGLDGRNSWLSQAAEPLGTTYTYLHPGESLTV